MGCWNETCGITQLPITDGDEVVVYLLREYGYQNVWSLIPVPFFGIYDDYGWIETDDPQQSKCNGISEYFHNLEMLKRDDAFVSLERIAECIRDESGVFRNSVGHKQKCVMEFFMIHKRVWLDLSNIVRDYYPIVNRSISGVFDEFTPISNQFQQFVSSLEGDRFVDEFTLHKFKKTIENRKDWSRTVNMIFSQGYGDWLMHEPLYNFIGSCSDEDIVRTAGIIGVMIQLRKSIVPQTGRGSQEGVSIFHDILSESYETTLQRLKNKHD